MFAERNAKNVFSKLNGLLGMNLLSNGCVDHSPTGPLRPKRNLSYFIHWCQLLLLELWEAFMETLQGESQPCTCLVQGTLMHTFFHRRQLFRIGQKLRGISVETMLGTQKLWQTLVDYCLLSPMNGVHITDEEKHAVRKVDTFLVICLISRENRIIGQENTIPFCHFTKPKRQ